MNKKNDIITFEKAKKLKELETIFINKLIKVRKTKKMSQRAFAEISGVLREQITKIERGTSSPTIRSLIKILEPHGYTVTIEKIKK